MPILGEQEKNAELENLRSTEQVFDSLFNEDKHRELIQKGERCLSRKAILNALFIMLYRNQARLHLPYLVIKNLIDIDESLTTWRYRHSLMAQRMLGGKIGTGGSSGHIYLRMAAQNNRVYQDLFNLSTFIIPQQNLPVLPDEILKELNF